MNRITLILEVLGSGAAPLSANTLVGEAEGTSWCRTPPAFTSLFLLALPLGRSPFSCHVSANLVLTTLRLQLGARTQEASLAPHTRSGRVLLHGPRSSQPLSQLAFYVRVVFTYSLRALGSQPSASWRRLPSLSHIGSLSTSRALRAGGYSISERAAARKTISRTNCVHQGQYLCNLARLGNLRTQPEFLGLPIDSGISLKFGK